MKRLRAAACAVAAPLLLGGCTQFGMFDDVGSDPHPPTMSIIRVAVQPPEAVEVTSRAVFDTNGLTLTPGSKIQVLLSFTDSGGDLVSFRIRDRDSALSLEGQPGAPEVDTDGDGVPDTTLDAPEFFTGTAGVVLFKDIDMQARQAGPHRFEMWAVDSHESRSEKVEFVINVALQ